MRTSHVRAGRAVDAVFERCLDTPWDHGACGQVLVDPGSARCAFGILVETNVPTGSCSGSATASWSQWREECANVPAHSCQLGVETRNRLRTPYQELRRRNGLRPEEITHRVNHKLSLGGFRFAEEALGVELDEGCRTGLRRYGHLGPNGMLLNLAALDCAVAAGGGVRGDVPVARPRRTVTARLTSPDDCDLVRLDGTAVLPPPLGVTFPLIS